MPRGGNSNDMVIRVSAETKQLVQDIENALREIEKSAKTQDFMKSLMGEGFGDIRKELEGFKNELSQFKSTIQGLDSVKFGQGMANEMKNLSEQLGSVHETIRFVAQDLAQLGNNNGDSLGTLVGNLSKLSTQIAPVAELSRNLNTLTQVLEKVSSASTSSAASTPMADHWQAERKRVSEQISLLEKYQQDREEVVNSRGKFKLVDQYDDVTAVPQYQQEVASLISGLDNLRDKYNEATTALKALSPSSANYAEQVAAQREAVVNYAIQLSKVIDYYERLDAVHGLPVANDNQVVKALEQMDAADRIQAYDKIMSMRDKGLAVREFQDLATDLRSAISDSFQSWGQANTFIQGAKTMAQDYVNTLNREIQHAAASTDGTAIDQLLFNFKKGKVQVPVEFDSKQLEQITNDLLSWIDALNARLKDYKININIATGDFDFISETLKLEDYQQALSKVRDLQDSKPTVAASNPVQAVFSDDTVQAITRIINKLEEFINAWRAVNGLGASLDQRWDQIITTADKLAPANEDGTRKFITSKKAAAEYKSELISLLQVYRELGGTNTLQDLGFNKRQVQNLEQLYASTSTENIQQAIGGPANQGGNLQLIVESLGSIKTLLSDIQKEGGQAFNIQGLDGLIAKLTSVATQLTKIQTGLSSVKKSQEKTAQESSVKASQAAKDPALDALAKQWTARQKAFYKLRQDYEKQLFKDFLGDKSTEGVAALEKQAAEQVYNIPNFAGSNKAQEIKAQLDQALVDLKKVYDDFMAALPKDAKGSAAADRQLSSFTAKMAEEEQKSLDKIAVNRAEFFDKQEKRLSKHNEKLRESFTNYQDAFDARYSAYLNANPQTGKIGDDWQIAPGVLDQFRELQTEALKLQSEMQNLQATWGDRSVNENENMFTSIQQRAEELAGKFGALLNSSNNLYNVWEQKIATNDIQNKEEFQKGVNYLLNKSDFEKLQGAFNNTGDVWSGWAEDAVGNVFKVVYSFDELNHAMVQSSQKVTDYTQAFQLLGKGAQTVSSSMTSFAKQTAVALIGIRSLYQAVYSGVQAFKGYDAALTNIKYTMRMTEQEFDALGQRTLDMAEKFNISVKDAMAISQIYANMQTTSEEILELGEPTAILANLSGVNASTAANYIQSVLQQFEMGADKAMHIVDVYNDISANIKMDYAKGIENIAGGIKAAGQVAYDAGLTFEQTAAIIAKTSERTREEGAAIGNSLKTIAVRLSKASKLSGADEVDNATLSDASKALNNIGIKVYQANGEFRELDVILGELAQKWDGLTDAQQAQISFAIAATRQTNKFRAILSAWTAAMDLAEGATNAQNSALENQAIYAESVAGKIQAIQTRIEELWIKFYNSAIVDDFLNGLNALFDKLNDFFDEADGKTVALGMLIGASLLKGISVAIKTGLPLIFSGIGTKIAAGLVAKGTVLASAAPALATAISGVFAAAAIAAIGVIALAVASHISKIKKLHQEAIQGLDEAVQQRQSRDDVFAQDVEKIKELRDELDSANLTEQERYQKRIELLGIQDDLIERYKLENGQLDLITGNMREQLQILEEQRLELIKKQALEKQADGRSNKEIAAEAATEYNRLNAPGFRTFVSRGVVQTEENQALLDLIDDLQARFPDFTSVLGDYEDAITKNLIVNLKGTPEQRRKQLQQLYDDIDKRLLDASGDTEEYLIGFKELVGEEITAIDQTISHIEDLRPLAEESIIYDLVSEHPITTAQGEELNPYTMLNRYERALSDVRSAMALGDEKAVAEAEKQLAVIQQIVDLFINGVTDNAARQRYDNYFDTLRTNLYSGVTARSYQFTNNTPAAQSMAGSLAQSGYTINQLKAQVFNNDQDRQMWEHLVAIAQTYGLTLEEVYDWLAKIHPKMVDIEDASRVAFTPRSLKDSVKNLDAMEDQLKKVADLYTGLDKEKPNLSASDLQTIAEAFGGDNGFDDKQMNSWLSKLLAANGDMTKLQTTMKEMMVDWAQAKDPFSQAFSTEAIEDTKRLLESMGFVIGDVTEEQEAMAEASAKQVSEQYDLIENENEIIEQLREEAGEAGMAESAYAALWAQKLLASGALNTTGDIIALTNLIGTLGAGTVAWQEYWQAREGKVAAAGKAQDLLKKSTSGVKDFSQEQKSQLAKFLNDSGFWQTKEGQAFSKNYKGMESWSQSATDVLSRWISEYQANLGTVNDADRTALEEQLKAILATNITGTNPEIIGKKPKDGGSSKGSGDKNQKEPEVIDFTERLIDRFKELKDEQDKVATDNTKNYSARLAAYESELDYLNKIKEAHKQQAKIRLQSYQDLRKQLGDIKNEQGEIVTDDQIEKGDWKVMRFDSENKKKLDQLLDLYDDYKESEAAILDDELEITETARERYELRKAEVQAVIDYKDAISSGIQSEIDLRDALGQAPAESLFKDLIRNSEETIESYQEQMDIASEYLDTLSEGTQEYDETRKTIIECSNAIIEAKAQQAEWNERIKKIPIERLDKYIAEIERIKTDVTNFISQVQAIGDVVDVSAYESLISASQEELARLTEQQAMYLDLLADYEWGSDKYEETKEALQEIDNTMSEIIVSMAEWNKALLMLPIDRINKVNEELNFIVSAMQEVEDKYDQVISAVTDEIDIQIDKIEEERKATEKMYEERIKQIQDVIDALEEENELREKRNAIESAEYDLERANTQKTLAVIRDGHKEYIADEEEIRKAQEALDEANYEYRLYELNQQIKDLEEERDRILKDYDDRIEALEKIAKKWEEITKNIAHAKDMLAADEFLGKNWEIKVLTGTDQDIYESFKGMYESLDANKTAYEEQAKSNERIAALMEKYVDEYIKGAKTYDEALSGIQTLASAVSGGLDVVSNLSEVTKFFGGGSYASILSTLSDSIDKETENYQQYFDIVEANNQSLETYTTTWKDLKESVDKQCEELKAAYEAALAAAKVASETLRVARDYSDSGSSGPRETHWHDDDWQHGPGWNADGTMKAHEGIEVGVIGQNVSSGDKLRALRAMSLTPLKDNEIPMILKKGEVVLTDKQQSTLLSNIHKLGTYGAMNAVSKPQSGTVVNLSMNNLTFHEIQNGQDFANYISKNLASAVAQNLNK